MVYNDYEPYQFQNNYYRRREPSIFDGLTLRPLPYPIIVILLVLSIFLGIKLYTSYEEVVEASGAQVNWLLLATPLVLIFAVKWLSSSTTVHEPSHGGRKLVYGGEPCRSSGGGSPWVVGALIVLVLVLVQFQSVFLDTWFGG
ncbi:hypothetical protein RND81_14G215400 [Saponaria officinalis]|uniref:Uncharacterized protein n=1 Tax=Saponaria officinalis TaxID=3572 RepID=A0AAW1GT40_SAPOF